MEDLKTRPTTLDDLFAFMRFKKTKNVISAIEAEYAKHAQEQ